MMTRYSKGFSLIEVLVAISIIAILSALGLSVYQAVYKNARDAQRKSDLKMIQSALEQYRNDQMYYPIQSGLTFGSPLAVDAKSYLSKVPIDPKAGQSYSYQPLSCNASSQNCTSYCLYAKLENNENITSDPECNNNYPACGAGYTCNFGVTKP